VQNETLVAFGEHVTVTSWAMMTDSDPAHGGPLQQRSAVELVEAYI
jgi:hypothetical protein